MRVTYAKCDACKDRLGEGHKECDAAFTVRTWFAIRELDVCRDCWTKMCQAVGG